MSAKAKGVYERAAQTHTLLPKLTWKDGLAISLVAPVALFARLAA